MRATDIGLVVVTAAIAVVLVAIAFSLLKGGGKVRAEASIDTTRKIDEMHEAIGQINRAVNHQGPNEPPLVERIIAIERQTTKTGKQLGEHVEATKRGFTDLNTKIAKVGADGTDVGTRLDAHILIAEKWQDSITKEVIDPANLVPVVGVGVATLVANVTSIAKEMAEVHDAMTDHDTAHRQ